ncbi:cysteine and histidine-rich protein 1 homolog isoform X3 [Amphibalanus amphitrite]|uniref:cysteine and histidine-rich protein 1 homolog isoform X3 n=1 Tax=Amphibalanus amphitrite TaxID=1232801 RepID=UPI001C909D14|nr:cysteine and histidine-rich protein 1 homolog isoform X3 [Amphibalanus amphitrite]
MLLSTGVSASPHMPVVSVGMCTNGHLMCAGCFTHLLADARLRDETATCPNCRIEISRSLVSRNLAVEKAVSELPSECQHCGRQFPRSSLEQHARDACDERPLTCRYSRIGCPWRGPAHELTAHQTQCVHPHNTGETIMGVLQAGELRRQREAQLYDTIFDLLSFEKILFNDLQMKPYRTDDFIHKLFYETSRFSAFNCQWVIKARINDNQRDPSQSCDRCMTYQLILKSKVSQPMSVQYLVLRGPFGDARVAPAIYSHEFSDSQPESEFQRLPLPDSAECNRMLAARSVNIRLIMFQVSK